MNLIVLSGSPKKDESVTLQSIKYLEIKNQAHKFDYVHIISQVNEFEKDPSALRTLCKKVQKADVVLWVFPVYHLLVPAHYKRFIELIFENNLESYFTDKYTAIFTTSIKYADNNAHDYMHGICDDLKMNFIDLLSHHMDDLPNKARQQDLLTFFSEIELFVNDKLTCLPRYKPLKKSQFKYLAGKSGPQVITDKRIIVITDASKEQNNVNEMIRQCEYAAATSVEVINLNDLSIKGYCLGCCRCGYDNTCIYRDGYRAFLDYVIEMADIIIYAGEIKDRYLSSLFKLYHDRSFTFNHVPHFTGKQFGFLIAGNFSNLPNLRQIFEHYHQETSNLAGIVSDEPENCAVIDASIYTLLKTAVFFSETGYMRPPNFLGVGGKSIFVEMTKGFTGAIFLADYRYYKKNNWLSDRTTLKTKIQNALMRYFMTKKNFRLEVQKNMVRHMISEHQKVLRKEIS
jgi:multimeric flavodoxin WrbA